ncbi:hypothetical protein [Phocaeicola abscessus]|uniref:hypothetical protein n=1 Tax=Phocaeicola abscessus TaxID=555313 RepID=UPI0028EDB44E|nr:hypothetical protein [Phocaeicola abscessus]
MATTDKTKELEELTAKFNALCDEQEKLPREGFAKVFEVLNGMEETFTPNHPYTENEDIINKALEITGHSNDEAFCKAFKRNNQIMIEGNKIQAKGLEIFAMQQLEKTSKELPNPNEWQFVPIRIFAPKEIIDNVINPMMERDAKGGKGLYGNITDIPEEDENLDEWFDIEAYGIKCSLEPLYRDLQNYGIVDSVLKNSTIREYYLKTIKSLIYFIRDNTNRPNKIRNHISKTLKGLDDIPAFGLLLQILLLQGLIKWFDDVDLKESDRGYNEACILIQWIGKLLMEKEVRFCYYRWGEDDKEYLKPLGRYLLSTEIGKAVQNHLFEKQTDCSCIIDGEHGTREIHKGIENNNGATDELYLPSELDAEQVRKYFAKAINVGYMRKEGNGYKWLFGDNKGQARLGYFCNKAFTPPRPINKLEEIFGVKKLSASITNADNEAKRADVKKWRDEMNNNIFND